MKCDVLIVGGGTGGTAAALAAAENGAIVCLLEESQQLGGQLTSQGVCTPDEQQHIETFGGTRRYMAFRHAVREYYRNNFQLTESAQKNPYLNPGSCWVSRLSFEPKVGAQLLRKFTLPFEEVGKLSLYFGVRVAECRMDTINSSRVLEVTAVLEDGSQLSIEPQYVIDATDLGDVLPLCGAQGTDWVVGAESFAETGEPDAPNTARPHWVQPLTFPFAIEWSPATAATNVIDPPVDYQQLKADQKYHVIHGAITGLFAGKMPWWNYRRILAAENFCDTEEAIKTDTAMINTAGNDFYGGNVIGTNADGSEVTFAQAEAALARARQASLGYLYWLQTECFRDPVDLAAAPGGAADLSTAGTLGYPEFRLRTDIFDTTKAPNDGCSPMPYIRESRRIVPLRRIIQQEIVVKDFSGNVCRGDFARSAFMHDSIGIGHYALDIHPNGHGEPNHYVATRPFQIPLGAIVPARLTNLLPGCKNLGVTHLTNGAYRLHPIEWNIGESVGALAAWCLLYSVTPRQVNDDAELLKRFQAHLLHLGIALHWYIDVPLAHPSFDAVQKLASTGVTIGSDFDLLFKPDDLVSSADWNLWSAACSKSQSEPSTVSRAAAAMNLIPSES